MLTTRTKRSRESHPLEDTSFSEVSAPATSKKPKSNDVKLSKKKTEEAAAAKVEEVIDVDAPENEGEAGAEGQAGAGAELKVVAPAQKEPNPWGDEVFPPDIIFRIVEIMVVSNMKRTAFRFMLCKKAYKEPIARILFRSISFLHFIKSPHWIRYSENPTFVRRLQVAYADFAKYPFLGGELMRRASPRLESLTLDFQREKLERTECLLDQLDGMIGLKHLVLDDVQQELLGSITILPATLTHVSLNMYWPYNVQPQIPAAFLAQLESLPALQSLSILPMNPNAYHIFAGLPPKLRPLLRTIGCDVKAFSTLTADEEFASLEIVQLSAQGATEAEVSKMFLTLAGKAPRLTKFEMVGAPCSAILTAWKTFPLLKNLTISLVGHEKVNENKDPLLHHTHFSDYENSIRSLLDERSTVVKITLGFTETDPDARKRKECRFWKRMRTGFPNQVKLAGYA